MPSVLEVDVPTPPSSAGAAQVSQSWLPKAGSTLQPDPMYRQKRLALEDDAPENTTAQRSTTVKASASTSGAKSARSKSAMSTATAPARRRPGSAPAGTEDLRAQVLSLKKELREAQEEAKTLKVRLQKSEAEVSSADEIDDDDFATS